MKKKKKVKKAKKKKRSTIIVPCKNIVKVGKLRLYQIYGGEALIYENMKVGKVLKSGGSITQLKKSLIHYILLDTKTEQANITLEVDLDSLDKFVQRAKKGREYFGKKNKERKKEGLPAMGLFFRHLNPEVSFMFRVKKGK